MVLGRCRLATGGEFSIEANPLDLTPERTAILKEFGVNRVSVGVQSFESRELQLLERDHSGAEARDAIRRLQHVIPNVGVDLIFGVPGQSLDDWRRNIEAAIALGPAHLSTYGLTFEKGTAFWTRREHGVLRAVPEETEREMYELAMELLPAAGYPQYELSNFARPGFECRHNQVYWDARSYYAFGPGAASYLGGVRRTNHRSTTTWIQKTIASGGDAPVTLVEELSAEERAREAVMLGLRRAAGIDLQAFAARFGFSIAELGGAALPRMVGQGLVEETNGWLRLTREGRCVADSVIAEFLVG
jgi:oxygen-independent coproporphyrinogen-3 oxidase